MNALSWDYTRLAEHYHQRAPYSAKLIKHVTAVIGLNTDSTVCDVGAGTGFLAREFAANGVRVIALEPNDEMRRIGQRECQKWPKISWFNARAERTGQIAGKFDLVAFGSSFNVVDRTLALQESVRIAKPNGWFLAMWNHRDLSGGLQQDIESYIKQRIPNYQYGTRRQDQQQYLLDSQLFDTIQVLREDFTIEQNSQDVITAWASHATLQRQAGQQHESVLDGITALIKQHSNTRLITPFYTQAWLAQFKS